MQYFEYNLFNGRCHLLDMKIAPLLSEESYLDPRGDNIRKHNTRHHVDTFVSIINTHTMIDHYK